MDGVTVLNVFLLHHMKTSDTLDCVSGAGEESATRTALPQ